MSPQEINRRAATVKTEDAINAIEGVPVSDIALHHSDQWERGEITIKQMKAAVLARHQSPSVSKNHI